MLECGLPAPDCPTTGTLLLRSAKRHKLVPYCVVRAVSHSCDVLSDKDKTVSGSGYAGPQNGVGTGLRRGFLALKRLEGVHRNVERGKYL